MEDDKYLYLKPYSNNENESSESVTEQDQVAHLN